MDEDLLAAAEGSVSPSENVPNKYLRSVKTQSVADKN
jgi:hypothetical protein